MMMAMMATLAFNELICDALRGLVSFMQPKNLEKYPWRRVTLCYLQLY